MKFVPAAITAAIAALILVLLFLIKLTVPVPEERPKADVALLAEEELFIEPELITPLGETETTENDRPAPAVKGDPVPAPEEQPEVKVPVETPKPTPPQPKTATQKKESPVKVAEESGKDKEKKEASSAVANKFGGNNGNPSGNQTSSSGVGGTGVGVTGSAQGRTFISCPKPDVTLRHKTIVKVSVVIDAEGKVTEATASGSADASIRRACERAARQARWSAKKGSAATRGTLTFNISPK